MILPRKKYTNFVITENRLRDIYGICYNLICFYSEFLKEVKVKTKEDSLEFRDMADVVLRWNESQNMLGYLKDTNPEEYSDKLEKFMSDIVGNLIKISPKSCTFSSIPYGGFVYYGFFTKNFNIEDFV